MKKFVFALLVFFLSASLAFATATTETGDGAAMPVSIYGKTAAGAVTSVRTDATGNIGAFQGATYTGVVSSQALAAGALSYTTAIAAKAKIKSVTLHAGSAISQTITMTIDNADGANYDTVIFTDTLVSNTDVAYIPANDLVLRAGDALKVQCTNTGTPAVTVYLSIIYESVN